MTDEQLTMLAERFCSASLPVGVAADVCATDAAYPYPRYGTHLLTVDQAKEVLRYVLDRSAEQREDDGLAGRIAEVMDEDGGCWSPCSGCQEGVDGYVSEKDYPYSATFKCQPGGGCGECGGLGVIWQDGAWLASWGDAPSASAVGDIVAERRRQVEQLGWTPEHDDTHGDDHALARAAACYALAGMGGNGPFWISPLQVPQQVWPYRWEWKPKGRRDNLIRAGALVVAEIERFDRLYPAQPAGGASGVNA